MLLLDDKRRWQLSGDGEYRGSYQEPTETLGKRDDSGSGAEHRLLHEGGAMTAHEQSRRNVLLLAALCFLRVTKGSAVAQSSPDGGWTTSGPPGANVKLNSRSCLTFRTS